MCLAYSKMRNLGERPYSQEEAEAAKYLMELTGLGGGDDPIGFLIASHRELVRQRMILWTKHPDIFNEIAFEAGDEINLGRYEAQPGGCEEAGSRIEARRVTMYEFLAYVASELGYMDGRILNGVGIELFVGVNEFSESIRALQEEKRGEKPKDACQ